MSEKFTYLSVDISCILIPALFTFHPRVKFYKQWKYLALPWVLTAFFFMAWDILFTKKGVWSFNPAFVLGVRIINLPIEECLFFFIVPYCCVFSYYCVRLFSDFRRFTQASRIFSSLLVFFLFSVAAFHLPRLYTSITFALLCVLFVYLLITKADYLPDFFFTFLLILIPFFISNGILTGSLIREPVVFYNDSYNLGIRMFTIPVEDTFYGMLLMLLNIAGFEYVKKRATRISATHSRPGRQNSVSDI